MITSPVSCYEPPLQVQLLTLRRHAASYSYTYTGALHPVRLSIDGSRSGNEAPLSGSPSREITMHLTRSFLDPPIPEDRRLRDLANAPKCRPRREAAAFYLRQSRSPFENLKASILSAAERHVNGDVEMSSQISGRHPERSGIELVRSTSEGLLKEPNYHLRSSPNSRRYGKAPVRQRVCARSALPYARGILRISKGRRRAKHLIVRLPKYPAFR